MLRVGLTGNIASGKSQASLVFAELGAHIIDADVIAHDLLSPGTDTCQQVVQAFGEGILGPDCDIDRKKLGNIIFHDSQKRLLLNSLVHPAIHNEISRHLAEFEQDPAGGRIVIVDAALLVESGHHKHYERLIVVTCARALQMARLVDRDGLSLEAARERLAAQMPIEEKLKLADYTIETSGTFRETREQIEAIYRDLLLQGMKKQRRQS